MHHIATRINFICSLQFVDPFIYFSKVSYVMQDKVLPTAFTLKVPSLFQFLSPLRQSEEQRRQVRDGDLLTLRNVRNTVYIHLKVFPDDTSRVFLTRVVSGKKVSF